MADVQHIFSGAGAPSSTPVAVGHHYIDTTNNVAYTSVGTSSSADWSAGGGGGGGGPVLDASGSKTYTFNTAAANEVVLLDDTAKFYWVNLELNALTSLTFKLSTYDSASPDDKARSYEIMVSNDCDGGGSGTVSFTDMNDVAVGGNQNVTSILSSIAGNSCGYTQFTITLWPNGTVPYDESSSLTGLELLNYAS